MACAIHRAIAALAFATACLAQAAHAADGACRPTHEEDGDDASALLHLRAATPTASPPDSTASPPASTSSPPATTLAEAEAASTRLVITTTPFWESKDNGLCWTAENATSSLTLTPCKSSQSNQVFTLVDYHFIQDFRGSCLYGNTSYTGFVECSDSSQSQWYQLPLTGSWGPVANCWCTSQDDCRRPCNEDDVLAVAVPTKDQASAMLVESLVLSANFTTFYFSYF